MNGPVPQSHPGPTHDVPSSSRSPSVLPSTSARRQYRSRQPTSVGHTTPFLGGHATLSSRLSRITLTSSSRCQAHAASLRWPKTSRAPKSATRCVKHADHSICTKEYEWQHEHDQRKGQEIGTPKLALPPPSSGAPPATTIPSTSATAPADISYPKVAFERSSITGYSREGIEDLEILFLNH